MHFPRSLMTKISFIKDDPRFKHPNDKLPAITANNPIEVRLAIPIVAPLESENCTVPFETGFWEIYSSVATSRGIIIGEISSVGEVGITLFAGIITV